MKKFFWWLVLVVGFGAVVYNLPEQYDDEIAKLETYQKEVTWTKAELARLQQREEQVQQAGVRSASSFVHSVGSKKEMGIKDAVNTLLAADLQEVESQITVHSNRVVELEELLIRSEEAGPKAYRAMLFAKRTVVDLVDKGDREGLAPTTEVEFAVSDEPRAGGEDQLKLELQQLASVQRSAEKIKSTGKKLMSQKGEFEAQLKTLSQRAEVLKIKVGQGSQKIGKSSFAKYQKELKLNAASSRVLTRKLATVLKEVEALKVTYAEAKDSIVQQQALVDKLKAD